MLSTISPFCQAESLLGGVGYGSVLPSSQGDFTPWENFESFFVSVGHRPPSHDLNGKDINKPEFKPNLKHHHADLGSGLDDPTQIPLDLDDASGNHESPNNQTSTITSSGSDDPNQNSNTSNSSSSHDDEPNQITPITDDRKRKRKISNRESARRSRMRKQRHVENLRDEANRLKLENQEGTDRLRLITYNIHLIRSDNDRLRGESVILQRRLMELSQIWQIQQLHRNNNNHHRATSCIPMQMI